LRKKKKMAEIIAPYLERGTKLNNKYVVISPLGEGGTSLLYLVKNEITDEILVIKEFLPKKFCTRDSRGQILPNQGREKLIEDSLAKFQYEADLMYKNSNVEGMVKVYEIFHERKTTYFAMEYLDGINLKSYVDGRGGKLNWDQTRSLMLPVFNSLINLHRVNIWHRDMSPDNIFILRDGKARIIDFGNAREGYHNADKKIDWAKEGFSPLEQYKKGLSQGPWTDVYGLAASIYYCLTGIAPLGSVKRADMDLIKKPGELGVTLPTNAENALMKALALNPENRFQTVLDFKTEIYKENITNPTAVAVGDKRKFTPKLLGLDGTYKGRKISLTQEIILGRKADECTLLFPSDAPGVSKVHCKLAWDTESDSCIITDLGATYGTKLISGITVINNASCRVRENEGFVIGENNVFVVIKDYE